MKEKVFVVSEFKNPSGEIVYRLYGRVDGERIRKNFATRAEARRNAKLARWRASKNRPACESRRRD